MRQLRYVLGLLGPQTYRITGSAILGRMTGQTIYVGGRQYRIVRMTSLRAGECVRTWRQWACDVAREVRLFPR